MRDPGHFTQEVEALPARSWMVVDEVQKLPAILNEVQDLLVRRGARYRFALTGSSARKLKRGEANLGQVTSVAGIARDAGVARPTVQGYFEILVDTLVGTWLPAWRPRAKMKEVAHPKFYFFDPGVVRALAGRLREPVGAEERGHLLEPTCCTSCAPG